MVSSGEPIIITKKDQSSFFEQFCLATIPVLRMSSDIIPGTFRSRDQALSMQRPKNLQDNDSIFGIRSHGTVINTVNRKLAYNFPLHIEYIIQDYASQSDLFKLVLSENKKTIIIILNMVHLVRFIKLSENVVPERSPKSVYRACLICVD